MSDISFDDFTKVELKVGTVVSAEEVEGSEKLIKVQVNLGEESNRQILAGIRKWYTPDDLIGKQVVVVSNLEPRKLMGMESQGMVLAVESKEGLALLTASEEIEPGKNVQ